MYICGKIAEFMQITIDATSSLPLYVQIEGQLREYIQKDEYKNGKMFPNEIDLSKQLGVSRSTIRQALNKLVFEGLLVRKKGVGTVVADKAVNLKVKNWLSFSQEMKSLGIKVKNFELHVSWELPDEELCSFFNLKNKDAEILKLERLRGKPNFPFVYFISYFNPEIGMTGEEDYSRPLYNIMETDYGVTVKLSREEISALVADVFLAKKLRLNQGDPVLKRKRFVYDTNGMPVEWCEGYYRADSFVYTIESDRD